MIFIGNKKINYRRRAMRQNYYDVYLTCFASGGELDPILIKTAATKSYTKLEFDFIIYVSFALLRLSIRLPILFKTLFHNLFSIVSTHRHNDPIAETSMRYSLLLIVMEHSLDTSILM